MNTRFLVCMGTVSSEDNSNYPVLLGLIDTTNVRNTVSCRDILTNTRICKTVYNLGLELTCNGYLFSNANNSWLLGLTVNLRSNIDSTAFKIISVEEDIWNYEDIVDDVSNPNIVQFKQDIKTNLRDDVSDEELTAVVQKLFRDTSTVVMDQYSYTADGVTPTDHSIDYKLSGCIYSGERMDNVQTDLAPISIGVKKLPMENETDDIPFPVPSFYDIMCSNRYFKNKEMQERMSDGDSDDDDEVIDSRLASTELFSDSTKISNDYSFESIYLGENIITASPYLIANADIDIPLINPKTVNVASVTPFWNVMPAVKLPPASFNKRTDESFYKLEDLIGSDSNNNLKLQDNERSFYNAFSSLLEVAIGIEYGAISEELYQENKDKKSHIVEDYLRTMSQEAFDLMWRHTGTTSATYTDDGADDSSSEVNEVVTYMKLPCLYGEVHKDSDSGRFVFENKLFRDPSEVTNADRYIHAVMPRLGLGFDGGARVSNSIKKDNSDNSGLGGLAGFVERNPSNKRWIDAYIRLLRWGSRKPTKLSLERLVDDDTTPIELTDPKYWDLNTSASSMHDGIIDNLVPVVDKETGSEYVLDRIIVQPNFNIPVGILKSTYGNVFDYLGNQTELNINLPIGVVLRKSYKDSTVETTIFEDIFTFYNKLKKGDTPYGPIKYKDNSTFMTFNDYNNLFVDVTTLSDILDTLGTRSDVIYDDTGKPYTIYYNISTNADVVKARTVVSNSIVDAFIKKSYKEQCEHISLFTAFSEFSVHPSKKSYVEDGKTLSTNPAMVIKPDESHRLVYQYLDKYCQIPCEIKVIEETEVTSQYNGSELINVEENITKSCVDIIDVLNNIEKMYAKVKAVPESIVNKNANANVSEDICWDEFKALITSNPNGYKFRGFTVNNTDYPFMLGCSLDRANMKYLVLTTEDLHKLEEEFNITLQCVKAPFTLSDKKKFFEIQKNILRYYQSIGRNLTSSKCNIGGFDYYLSSVKIPRKIYDYNKK